MKIRIRIVNRHWRVRVPGEINERRAGSVAALPLHAVVQFALEFMKVPF